MAESLIKMLIAGPEVSFNGSPTVSPITAATLSSLILSPCSLAVSPYLSHLVLISPEAYSALNVDLVFSISFLQLSQAPPVFEAEMAT